MSRTQRVRFPAADGVVLDGRLRRPDGRSRGSALLCHPHPAFGGHMDAWLLPAVSEVLADAGWTTLRFNFRGVRRGGGVSRDACEEVADLAGACALARARTRGARRCAVVGWSFGALIGLLHGLRDPRVTDWVGIAPAVGPTPGVVLPPLPEGIAGWAARRTVIVGEHDAFYPVARMNVLAPHALDVLPGADHFLFDRDDDVAARVAAALRVRLPA